MTGFDVSEIQKMLHDAGLGEIVGSIDGKLGKKTLRELKNSCWSKTDLRLRS